MGKIPEHLQAQIQKTIVDCTRPICDILDYVLDNTTVHGITLSMDELYAIAIRLPAECAYFQQTFPAYKQMHSYLYTKNDLEFVSDILPIGIAFEQQRFLNPNYRKRRCGLPGDDLEAKNQ